MWLRAWRQRRARQRDLESRAREAEAAARRAASRWPEVHRAADAFAAQAERAMRHRRV